MKGLLVIFLCFLSYSLQKCTIEDDHYVAAVVEFPLNTNVTNNLMQYVKIIKKAAKKNADIIVFPERTLTGVYVSVSIPIYGLLKKYPIPAEHPDRYDNILVKLSSAAKENGIYVVANVREVLDCTQPQKGEQCPGKRKYFYSTNVVFDRKGALFVRYRKIEIFGEPFLTAYTGSDNMAIFDTDFGVTFANFIELDIIFQVPQMKSIAERKVTDIVYPALWFSEQPYFDAPQVQSAISYSLNVNMLAAGANAWEDRGAGGSGIYSGKSGALISVVRKVTSYRLLVAQVPKIPGDLKQTYPGPLEAEPAELDSMIGFTDTSLDTFLTKTLEPGYQEFTLEYQDVSCSFTVNITLGSGEQYYRYRAVAFSGVRKLVVDITGGVRTCSIISCTDDGIYSCAKRFPTFNEDSIAQFSELKIIGTLPTPAKYNGTNAQDGTFYATSLKTSRTNLQPDDVDQKQEVQGSQSIYTVSLKNLESQLYTFGFYGRNFVDDGKPVSATLAENIVTKMNMGRE